MDWLNAYVGDVQFVSWLFQRMLAAIYFLAFLGAFQQFPALLGHSGLQPVTQWLEYTSFKESPTLFHWRYSDNLLRVVAASGCVLSGLLLFAANDFMPWWCTTALWLGCYALYLSIVNVGQTFYAFGWESMLLEAGFFAAFFAPAYMVAPAVPILLMRWLLFRNEFGAGLIKLRHDECWKDLTCLYYHHETQPLPNPLSWYFHRMPKWFHRSGVMFSHVVQLVMPFLLFAPQPVAAIAAALIIAHQMILIVSGNYAWLNWITVALGITGFSDSVLHISGFHAGAMPISQVQNVFLLIILGVTAVLSVQPTLNLFSKKQLMNYSYNPYHLVNTYGAFGSISRERYEVVIEGTDDATVTAATVWKEYEFKAKPGGLNRTPPQVAPYHLRLDWLMWFIPFSVYQVGNQLVTRGYELWFIRFVEKLLRADAQTLRLIKRSPFGAARPRFIRARYYLYEYTSAKEKKETGNVWKRTLLGEYLPAVRLEDIESALSPRSFSLS